MRVMGKMLVAVMVHGESRDALINDLSRRF